MAPLRVGTVPYLVARPLDSGLEDEPGIELERRVPSALVEGLREGRLDVALVSSIELFRRPGYAYLDGPAVAGRGRVRSVQVFLRRPLQQVRDVALDPASRAAQALTRIVLPRRAGAEVRFREATGGPEGDADAWLEIGDPALRRTLAAGAPSAFNPCAAWTDDTGLPFAFAVWIVRPGVAISPAAREAFLRARERGAARIPGLAGEAARGWGLPEGECLRYLQEECLYAPGPQLAPALLAFRDAAGALGLCDRALAPLAI